MIVLSVGTPGVRMGIELWKQLYAESDSIANLQAEATDLMGDNPIPYFTGIKKPPK